MALQADDIVGLALKLFERACGGDRHSQHQYPRAFSAYSPEGGSHCRARGNAVIDHNDNAILKLCARPVRQVKLPAPFDFSQFPDADLFEFLLGHGKKRDDILVAHHVRFRAIDNRAHGKLGLHGNPKLTDQD